MACAFIPHYMPGFPTQDSVCSEVHASALVPPPLFLGEGSGVGACHPSLPPQHLPQFRLVAREHDRLLVGDSVGLMQLFQRLIHRVHAEMTAVAD